MAISNRLTLILIVFCAAGVFANFGFPESEEENDSKKNAQVFDRTRSKSLSMLCNIFLYSILKNKKPVFLPQQCNENELFYAGDHKDDWGKCIILNLFLLLYRN